jgi:hypothetical protein
MALKVQNPRAKESAQRVQKQSTRTRVALWLFFTVLEWVMMMLVMASSRVRARVMKMKMMTARGNQAKDALARVMVMTAMTMVIARSSPRTKARESVGQEMVMALAGRVMMAM